MECATINCANEVVDRPNDPTYLYCVRWGNLLRQRLDYELKVVDINLLINMEPETEQENTNHDLDY